MESVALGKLLLIFLGDFIAHVPTTYCACNSCQGFAIATTDLIAQQPADNSANTDAQGAVFWSWSGLRWRLCDRGLRGRRRSGYNLRR
jgi:hypothetical protein